MDESTRRLLGIQKKASNLSELAYRIRKRISIRFLIVAALVLVFFSAAILFTRFEVIGRPDLQEKMEAGHLNPYLLSVYWLVTTVATVGYGDVTPITFNGIILTMVVMLLGVISVSLLTSIITSRIVAMNLGSMFGVSKTRRKIDCIICGWNPIAEAAFNELKGPGVEIVVIDTQNRPELAKAKNIHFLSGDPTNPDILKRANIANAKSVVLAMEEDSEVLLAIHVIRDLNPWVNIVAKINNHEHIRIAESAGADHVVSPPSIGGRLLSLFADEPHAVDWILRATSGEKGIQLVEYAVTKESPFANKTVGQTRSELGDRARIIGVDTAEGFEKIPGEDLRIEPGNKLIMLIDSTKYNIEDEG